MGIGTQKQNSLWWEKFKGHDEERGWRGPDGRGQGGYRVNNSTQQLQPPHPPTHTNMLDKTGGECLVYNQVPQKKKKEIPTYQRQRGKPEWDEKYKLKLNNLEGKKHFMRLKWVTTQY